MRLRKLLLATTSASALLCALAGGASARAFSTSSQTFRTVFRTVTFNGVFGDIRCSITLEGSLHARTIAKVVGSLVGYVTRADLGACETGRATVLRETLPWHARYSSFTGTLPSITRITTNVIGLAFRIQEPFAGCLATSTSTNPAILAFEKQGGNGVIDDATLGGTLTTTCGVNGSFSSTRGPVTVLNSTTRITVTLI
ncbi:MAG TPA: hypothetical protein VFS37_07915 [Conexibacter sp.]|nr:hypothetical protein [Conexibacter sp.]